MGEPVEQPLSRRTVQRVPLYLSLGLPLAGGNATATRKSSVEISVTGFLPINGQAYAARLLITWAALLRFFAPFCTRHSMLRRQP